MSNYSELCKNCGNTRGSHRSTTDGCPASEARMDWVRSISDDLKSRFAGSGVVEGPIATAAEQMIACDRPIFTRCDPSEIADRIERARIGDK